MCHCRSMLCCIPILLLHQTTGYINLIVCLVISLTTLLNHPLFAVVSMASGTASLSVTSDAIDEIRNDPDVYMDVRPTRNSNACVSCRKKKKKVWYFTLGITSVLIFFFSTSVSLGQVEQTQFASDAATMGWTANTLNVHLASRQLRPLRTYRRH